ncbi:MAG TPA: biopolymer transporter ExbD [Pirellulaceae bacterium]|nr:biopolymer transporter ExbD [Pirellulaceae bacterium]
MTNSDINLSDASSVDETGEGGFELMPPTGELAHLPDGDRPPLESITVTTAQPGRDIPAVRDDDRARRMAWKGLEDDDPDDGDEDPPVDFSQKGPLPADDMDMTPMVDVVFLLLIFFMVTASFTLQQTIETPPAITEDPSIVKTDDQEVDEEYVEVIVDQNNSYFVTTKSQGDVEAPTEREMRERIKQAKVDFGARVLKIRAHTESTHGRVTAVWDSGIAIGMDQIILRTTEEDY